MKYPYLVLCLVTIALMFTGDAIAVGSTFVVVNAVLVLCAYLFAPVSVPATWWPTITATHDEFQEDENDCRCDPGHVEITGTEQMEPERIAKFQRPGCSPAVAVN